MTQTSPFDSSKSSGLRQGKANSMTKVKFLIFSFQINIKASIFKLRGIKFPMIPKGDDLGANQCNKNLHFGPLYLPISLDLSEKWVRRR